MRIARFKTKSNEIRYGIIGEDSVYALTGNVLGEFRKGGKIATIEDVQLLAPIVPPNLLAIGQNYKAHVDEGNDKYPTAPPLFIKATTSVNNPDGDIVLPKDAPNEVDYEAELAVIIKKAARYISKDEALDYVLGFTCANDISARDCQRNDVQWARGKSFETFAPLGPWIETELDPKSLKIQCRLNGEVMQDGSTSLMIFDVATIISYLSQCMTLLPGTVILTGTPAGCGFAKNPPVWLRAGDELEVQIEGIGTLKNSVVDEN